MTLVKIPATFFEHQTLQLEFRLINISDGTEFYHFILRNKLNFLGPFPVTCDIILKGISSTKQWIKNKIQDQNDNKSAVYIVKNRSNGEIVAMVSVFGFDWRVPKCEIAWMLSAEYEKLGIANNAVLRVIQSLLHETGIQKIICRIEPKNVKSYALAKRLGFEMEGMHRSDFRDGNGKLVDVQYFGLWPKKV